MMVSNLVRAIFKQRNTLTRSLESQGFHRRQVCAGAEGSRIAFFRVTKRPGNDGGGGVDGDRIE